VLIGAAPVAATTSQPARVPLAPSPDAVPRILSPEDAERYRRIFELQDKAKWRAADKLIARLENRLLMGHVLFQRYMHPTGYRSRFRELSRWLSKYADHPGARRVYRLARKRQPKGVRAPRRPLAIRAARGSTQRATPAPRPVRALPADKRREIAQLKRRITRYLRRNRPDRAEKRLWAAARVNLLGAAAFDRELARIAESYFYRGKDNKALALARLATRSRDSVPRADWTAALAAWRLGEWEEAAGHFEALASSDRLSPWQAAAGAYWAARAYLVTERPGRVIPLLERAAVHKHTFYGLIAARQLGRRLSYSWDVPPLDADALDQLLAIPGAKRAIALVEAGKPHLADQELRLVARRARPNDYGPVLGLAARLNLPATQLVLADLVFDDTGHTYDAALYPVPDWQPKGGFSLDRAILYAIIRQESRFNNQAISSVGARGLMQLMPRTASFIARDRSLRYSNKTKLYSPDFNMALGQRYLQHLLDLKYTERNLFLIATAYNGGPGNLMKWLKRTNFKNDWLLFIESIPASETRDFIERVLSNLWIYRMRLGQPTPTLDSVAAGGWPLYTALDTTQAETGPVTGDRRNPWPESTTPAPSYPSTSR